MFDFLNICSPFYAPPTDSENDNPEVDSVEPYYLVYGEQVDEPELFERIKLSTKEIYCTAADEAQYVCTACAYAEGWARLAFTAERVTYTYETGRGWSVKPLGKDEHGIPFVSKLNDGSAFTVNDGKWDVGTPTGGSIDADTTPEDAGKLLGVKDDGSIGLIDAVYGVPGQSVVAAVNLLENYYSDRDSEYYWDEVPEFNEINFELNRAYTIGLQMPFMGDEVSYTDFFLSIDEKSLYNEELQNMIYFKYVAVTPDPGPTPKSSPADSDYEGWVIVTDALLIEELDYTEAAINANIYMSGEPQRRIPVKYIDGIETFISSEGHKLVAAGYVTVTNNQAASFEPGMSVVQVTDPSDSQNTDIIWFVDEDNIEGIVDFNSQYVAFGAAMKAGADLIVMFDPKNMRSGDFGTIPYATVCNMGSEATETFDIGDIAIEVPTYLFAKVNPILPSDDEASEPDDLGGRVPVFDDPGGKLDDGK